MMGTIALSGEGETELHVERDKPSASTGVRPKLPVLEVVTGLSAHTAVARLLSCSVTGSNTGCDW